jgi:uncharacterized membrane protein
VAARSGRADLRARLPLPVEAVFSEGNFPMLTSLSWITHCHGMLGGFVIRYQVEEILSMAIPLD